MTKAAPSRPGPITAVRNFLGALENLDVDHAMSYAAPDMVYQNMPLPAARGRQAVDNQLRTMTTYGTGFRADIHNIAANGGTVLTERTDALHIGAWEAEFWVCGTFEVTDGTITLWRDYFDWSTLLVSSVRGALHAAAATASRLLTTAR